MTQRLLGYAPDELARSPFASFYSPELAPPQPQVAEALLVGPQAHELFAPASAAAAMAEPGYLAVYGEWMRDENNHLYAGWATERMTAMQAQSVGIQLADENLGKRPAPFMKDENLARLDSVRQTYDLDGLFRSWMGRPDQ